MKYLYPFLLLLLVTSLISCDDANDKIERKKCVVVMHPDVRMVLYNESLDAVDTITINEKRYLNGTINIDKANNKVGYSANGIHEILGQYYVFDNIYFNLRNDELEWIGNSSINSGFFFTGLHINKSLDYDTEFSFGGAYTSESPIKYFVSSYDNFIIHIEGTFTFIEKRGKEQNL